MCYVILGPRKIAPVDVQSKPISLETAMVIISSLMENLFQPAATRAIFCCYRRRVFFENCRVVKTFAEKSVVRNSPR